VGTVKKRGGKFLGAALGYTFGGPLGALLGAAIGYAVDEDGGSPGVSADAAAGTPGQGRHPRFTKESAREIAYVEMLILFLTGAARADGLVTGEKVETIRRFFRDRLGYGGTQYALIARLVDESFHKNVDLPRVCAAIAVRTVYEERLYLTQLAYRVSVADGVLTAREEAYIGQAARLLGVEEQDLSMIAGPFARFRDGTAHGTRGGSRAGGGPETGEKPGPGFDTTPNPYTVLGVPPSSSDDEVQKAYRFLANKYHPDKVLHLGQEFIDLANRKFTMIALAYERIRKERGLA
jgi:DnaJ like chaperone protein